VSAKDGEVYSVWLVSCFAAQVRADVDGSLCRRRSKPTTTRSPNSTATLAIRRIATDGSRFAVEPTRRACNSRLACAFFFSE
jgi:hypothetical protein